MSLLLDALKSTEAAPDAADSSGVAPEAWGPEEEPLDGPATLALLASKPTAQTDAETTLSLVPASGIAAAPAATALEQFGPGPVESSLLGPSLVGPAPAGLGLAAPAPVVEVARTVPNPGPAAAAPANPRAVVTAPPSKPRAKTYILTGAALAATRRDRDGRQVAVVAGHECRHPSRSQRGSTDAAGRRPGNNAVHRCGSSIFGASG